MRINYKYNLGDSIKGDHIVVWAGKIKPKGQIKKDNLVLKTLEFSLSVECMPRVPITSHRPSVAGREIVLEGLKGRKIYGEAEEHSRFRKVTRTARHRQWETALKENAYCCINIAIKSCQ